MSKFKRFKTLAAALCAVLCFGAAALAFQPEEALSPRPEKSVYSVWRIENLGNFLRWAVTEDDLKLIAPVAGIDESMVSMVLATLAKIPVEAVALSFGADETGNLSLQFAAAIPEALKAKMELISKGEAKAGDLAAVLLGEDSPVAPMADAMLDVQPVKDEAGLISVSGFVFMGVKDNLLIAGLNPTDVKAGFEALEKPEKRLNLKRQFNTKSFVITHVDTNTLEKIEPPSDDDPITKADYAGMREMFKAPVDSEIAFEKLADRFRASLFMNVREALADKYLKNLEKYKPVKGGYIKLIGDRTPIFAFGSVFNGEALKNYPGIANLWSSAVKGLKSVGISEELFVNMLTGSLSLSIGGSLVSDKEGMKLPAIILEKEGVNGAAAEILKIVADKWKDAFTKVEAEGWDTLLKLDPSKNPVQILCGNKGEMLFAGCSEPDSLAKTPKVSGQLADIMDKESHGSLYFDFAAIQEYFKDKSTNAMAFASENASAQFGDKAPAVMAQVDEILNAKLSVPSMGLWTSDIGTVVIDFMTQDVAAKDSLFAKLVGLYQVINAPVEAETKQN